MTMTGMTEQQKKSAFKLCAATNFHVSRGRSEETTKNFLAAFQNALENSLNPDMIEEIVRGKVKK